MSQHARVSRSIALFLNGVAVAFRRLLAEDTGPKTYLFVRSDHCIRVTVERVPPLTGGKTVAAQTFEDEPEPN